MADAGKVVIFNRHERQLRKELKVCQLKFLKARARWLTTRACDHPEEFVHDSTQVAGDFGSRRCTVCKTVIDPAYR